RSYALNEDLSFDFAKANHHVNSTDGRIEYIASYPLHMRSSNESTPESLLEDQSTRSRPIIKWQREFAGLCFVLNDLDGGNFHWFFAYIPYWSLVVPLLIVTACLLFGGSRRRAPTNVRRAEM